MSFPRKLPRTGGPVGPESALRTRLPLARVTCGTHDSYTAVLALWYIVQTEGTETRGARAWSSASHLGPVYKRV